MARPRPRGDGARDAGVRSAAGLEHADRAPARRYGRAAAGAARLHQLHRAVRRRAREHRLGGGGMQRDRWRVVRGARASRPLLLLTVLLLLHAPAVAADTFIPTTYDQSALTLLT